MSGLGEYRKQRQKQANLDAARATRSKLEVLKAKFNEAARELEEQVAEERARQQESWVEDEAEKGSKSEADDPEKRIDRLRANAQALAKLQHSCEMEWKEVREKRQSEISKQKRKLVLLQQIADPAAEAPAPVVPPSLFTSPEARHLPG